MAAGLSSVPYERGDDADLAATVAAVEDEDRRVIAAKADVRSSAQLDEAVGHALDQFGRIDIVCANAGIYSQADFWEMSDQMWQDMIDINLTGVWRTAKAVAPHLIEQRRGSIVLTSSVNGFQPGWQIAHYVAAKHGVIGLMRNFANELAPYGVRCNAVCPGAIDTVMLNNPHTYERFAGKPGGTREEAIESVRHFHLLHGRSMLPPTAVSDAIAYLCSDAAEHVTGVALPVDAGHLAMDGYNPAPTT